MTAMPLFMPLRSDGFLGRPSTYSASNNLSIPSSEPLAQSGSENGQFGQEWFMVNVIKAAANIRVEHPCTTVLLAQRHMDGLNRIHRAAPWPKAVGVGFKARLPFWLQGRLDDCLHHPVLAGRYAQGSLFPVVFRDIHPSVRAGRLTLVALA